MKIYCISLKTMKQLQLQNVGMRLIYPLYIIRKEYKSLMYFMVLYFLCKLHSSAGPQKTVSI